MIKDILTNMNMYFDGNNFVGEVQELTPPKVTPKFREYMAGGMGAAVDIPTGEVEKLESSFTLNSVSKVVLKQLKVVPGSTVPFEFRGATVSQDGTKGKVVVTQRGLIKETDYGSWKPGDDTSLKIGMTLDYYRLSIDDEVIHEIDPVNFVCVIDGVDQTKELRSALGI
ncbi:phage major tail tube protein [Candidatus Sororendozoicomonas aggregata]|uniref:phage major tail tube protein n=1 Tax=Candidatus Sororendozoicomonas aggregata TaxID=3073239 RepID=UPI002ED41BB6